MSWTDKILKTIKSDEIISDVADKVMDSLDLDQFVRELQEKLVSTLIERITAELSEAIKQ